MKRFTGCLILAAFMVSCTDLDPLKSEIDALAERILQIEKRCERLNTDLASLSVTVAALEKGDMVTSVTPLLRPDGSVEGYLLFFRESGMVTIYNGSEGEDGKDAVPPVISVMKDSDGKYYWTSDGQWILDPEGNRMEVSDGRTLPLMKVEGDKWYVSYDGGANWEFLADYLPESDGYVFRDVDLSDPQSVQITLSDGSVIRLPLLSGAGITLKCLTEGPAAAGSEIVMEYSVASAGKASVVVDDSDIYSSSVEAYGQTSGKIVLVTRSNASLQKQRAFIIFNVDGGDDDWWLVGFDNAGQVVISDIR